MPVDLIVHLAHAPMPHLRYRNVFFYDTPTPLPESWTFLDAALPLLTTRVGILTTTQHRHWVPSIVEYLTAKGFAPAVSEPDRRVAYAAQVLGCDYFTATNLEDRVDSYLYVGTGDFHPLGVALIVDKPVVIADPSTGEARTLEEVKDRVLRQRWGAIVRAENARTFGIIVSRKIGQDRSALAVELKAKLEVKGRSGHLFYMDFVGPELLEGYKVDAWVSTACPRIAIEDYLRYKQPILTPQELEIVLGERTWDDYVLDEIRA
jgi:2-(3-amino-3-carboxypropyl)histidine synthase